METDWWYANQQLGETVGCRVKHTCKFAACFVLSNTQDLYERFLVQISKLHRRSVCKNGKNDRVK